MSFGYLSTLRNNRLDEITALIDAGVSAGFLRIYDGARPSTGGTVTTLLAELTLSDPSFPAAVDGTMSANAITNDAAANATGTATWFRVVDSVGNFVLDGDCGVVDSGKDLELNTTDVVINVEVSITQFDITHGNA